MFHPLNALIFCPYMQECLPIGRYFFGDVNDTNLRFISNNHCEITYSNDQFLIRDTASTNGTWLNHSTLATNERKVVIQNDFISLASPMFSDDFDATKSSIVIFWTRIAPQYHPLD
jgi:FHA domain